MYSNSNAVKEGQWINGYYDYIVDDLGRVWQLPFKEPFMPHALQLRPRHIRIYSNLKPEILMELPNGIFKNSKQVWSWAQRVQLSVQRGSTNPHHSRSSHSISSGD